MSNVKRQPSWNRTYIVSPRAATLLGVAIGLAVATVAAFAPPRDFSYSFLSILLVTIPPFCGIAGYILWLSGEPRRYELFERITRMIAFPAMLGLLVAFSAFWWKTGHAIRPGTAVMLMGFICGLAMFVVGAGWGTIHFVGYLASSWARSIKARARSSAAGVWDRELDEG
jgi:cytochrome bd-type quinol oxidase subunit 2